MSRRKSSIGMASDSIREARMRRPFFHVVIRRKIPAPTTRGNHPPAGILITFAPKKARSMTRKKPVSAITGGRLQPHFWRATTPSRTVVMTIVEVTATP